MHFLCASILEDFYQTRTGRAANDGVIHEDDALSLQIVPESIQLDANRALALVLTRLNKGSADIFVFNQAYIIWNT